MHSTLIAFVIATSNIVAASERVLIHEAIIDAPIADVWRLSTTSEGASKWMAPKVIADLRVGGSFRASYHPESNLNDEHTIVNRILTYAPQRLLSIQNVQAPAGFQHMDHFQQTWTVIYFDAVEEDKTKIRMVGLGYGEGAEWDVLYRYFEQGNKQVLTALQRAAVADREVQDVQDKVDEPVALAPTLLPPIETEININAKLNEVWRALTTTEGIKSFLAPEANVDLRIGGPYEMFFLPDAPEGERGSDGSCILAYEPQRMLSFSWNAPPHLPFARQHPSWVVITLEDTGDEGVRVRLAQYGLDELRAAHEDHADEFVATWRYFRRAWPAVLTALKMHLEEA